MPLQDLPLRIVEAALEQFGSRGFDGASTRDIAKASGVAMSSITYHFGGKQGLFLACADHIADVIGAVLLPSRERIEAQPPQSPQEASEWGLLLLENFATLMLSPQSATFASFVAREQQHPTEAFERLYERIMRPMIETSLGLLAITRPALSDQERRALILSVMGMALVLRLARACVVRTMQVEDMDEATAAFLLANLRKSAATLLSPDPASGVPTS